MNIFEKIKSAVNLVNAIGKEHLKEVGKEMLKHGVSMLANKYRTKQYNCVVYGKNDEVLCEIIIIPKKDELILGLGEGITEPKSYQIGKNRIEIKPIEEILN